MGDQSYLAVLFGLASAATWGVGDFSGGLATRRAPVLGVVVASQATGLAVMLALALLSAEPFPAARDLLWGAAAGIVGQIGLIAFYRAMAIGQVSIAAPLTAVLSAIIPVIFGALTQGLPGTHNMVGFLLALAGVWYISRPQELTGGPAGLRLAILGGVGFSAFFILIGQVSHAAVFWPLAAARVASISFMSSLMLLRGNFVLPPRRLLPLVMFAGVMDVGGNTFFVLAEQAGRIDVASVLASLYPATTVLLALIILKEKVTRLQTAGVLLMLFALPLIAIR